MANPPAVPVLMRYQLELAPFTSTTSGVVPASGGGTTNFLRADGTWVAVGGGSASWGAITGTLSSQTDLNTALTARVLKAGDTMTGQLIINPASGPIQTWNSAGTLMLQLSSAGELGFGLTPVTNGGAIQLPNFNGLPSGIAWGTSIGVVLASTGILRVLPASGNGTLQVSNSTTTTKCYMTSTGTVNEIGGVGAFPTRLTCNSAAVVTLDTSLGTTLAGTLTATLGTTTSTTPVSVTGSNNNYFEININGTSAGTGASSDVVATADTGSSTTNYIDLGINSSGYTGGVFGAALEGYLYTSDQNLNIGAAASGKKVLILAGGSSTSTNTVATFASATTTIANKLVTAVSTTSAAGLNLPSGVDPTTPSSGDFWYTNAALFYSTGSATRVIASVSTPSGLGIANTIVLSAGGSGGNLTGTNATTITTVSGGQIFKHVGGTCTASVATAALSATCTFSGAAVSGDSFSAINGTVTLTGSGGSSGGAINSGGRFALIANPTSGTSPMYTGVSADASNVSSTTLGIASGSLIGGYFTTTYSHAYTGGTGVLTSLIGVSASTSLNMTLASGSQTISNIIGLNVDSPSNVVTTAGVLVNVLNYYGCKLTAPVANSGSGTLSYSNNYAFWQNDSTAINYFAGNVKVATAGNTVFIKEGSNAKMGLAVLVAGAVTVSTTAVTASSRIFLCCNVQGGTTGYLRVSAKTAGTSFTITSSSGTDTSSVAWVILEAW